MLPEGVVEGTAEAGPRFAYRAPIEPLQPADWEPTPAGDSLDESLLQLLSSMRHGWPASAVFVERDEITGGDSVRLFPTKPRCVLVVGASPLAEKVRSALMSGRLGGWQLHALPEVQTSIQGLEPRLKGRYYNLLMRNEITTVEEAAAIPEEGWLELRNVGRGFVGALAGALAAHGAGGEVAHPALANELEERRKHIEARMQPTVLARYRDFCQLLIQSRIPLAAVAKIAETLNAEPVPPADPMAMLLLETAGERHLLDRYLDTHWKETTASAGEG